MHQRLQSHSTAFTPQRESMCETSFNAWHVVGVRADGVCYLYRA